MSCLDWTHTTIEVSLTIYLDCIGEFHGVFELHKKNKSYIHSFSTLDLLWMDNNLFYWLKM